MKKLITLIILLLPAFAFADPDFASFAECEAVPTDADCIHINEANDRFILVENRLDLFESETVSPAIVPIVCDVTSGNFLTTRVGIGWIGNALIIVPVDKVLFFSHRTLNNGLLALEVNFIALGSQGILTVSKIEIARFSIAADRDACTEAMADFQAQQRV